MATVHITSEQAASNISDWIARALAGDEVIIDNPTGTPVVMHKANPTGRTLAEALKIARLRESSAVLDGDFEKDLLEIQQNSEPFEDKWA